MRYVILSDMHMGTEESSLNNQLVRNGIIAFFKQKSPFEEIIFSGDVIDLNLSTFRRSIEGESTSNLYLYGFRDFIAQMASSCAVKKWVYLPGNHDYKIWDLLATAKVCTNVLSNGNKLIFHGPLMKGLWKGDESFIAGIFPKNEKKKVLVEYPDHIIKSGNEKIIVTHGHYLDYTQTLFNRIDEMKDDELRKIFIETAQYQAIAAAVSYTEKTRKLMNLLFGPSNIREKIKFWFKKIFTLSKWDSSIRNLRGKGIDENMLVAIERYLRHFGKYNHDSVPTNFIFGHTHVAGVSNTSSIRKKMRYYKKNIQVYNAGGFYPNDEIAATFIMLETGGSLKISIYGIDSNGIITPLY